MPRSIPPAGGPRADLDAPPCAARAPAFGGKGLWAPPSPHWLQGHPPAPVLRGGASVTPPALGLADESRLRSRIASCCAPALGGACTCVAP
eukprot:14608331-Alexandrium_andersonii.AAC.1